MLLECHYIYNPHGGLYRSMGVSSNVKARGLSLRNIMILLVLFSERWKVIIEENFEIYLGHSVSRCEWDWYLSKHVHPRGLLGKKRLLNLPVGTWPETSRVNQLYNVMFPVRCMKNLPLLSHALGSIIFFFFLRCSSLCTANGCQTWCHSLITEVLFAQIHEEMVIWGAGNGPIGWELAAWSANLLIWKPRWLGIHRNSISLSSEAAIHCPNLILLSLDSSNKECGLTLTSDFNVDWLSMNTRTLPWMCSVTNSIAMAAAFILASYKECALTSCLAVCVSPLFLIEPWRR